MTLIESFKNSTAVSEYKSNPRLQWLILGVAVILVLYFVKMIMDNLEEKRQETAAQMQLLGKLESAAAEEINLELVKQAKSNLTAWSKDIPSATSASTAEAQALAIVEQMVGSIFTRKRLNLIGSEEVYKNLHTYWSVRTEVAGQLDGSHLIDVLNHFDSTHKHAKIASLQYSPKSSDSANLVIDIMFKSAPNE